MVICRNILRRANSTISLKKKLERDAVPTLFENMPHSKKVNRRSTYNSTKESEVLNEHDNDLIAKSMYKL